MSFRTHHCFGFGVASVAGLLFTATPAVAGGDKAHGEHHKAMWGLEKMDSNGDGQVSREEHTAGAKKMFDTMDADKDGKVTAAEMEAAHAQMAGKDAKKMKGEMTVANKIKKVDTNGDGVLSAEEHTSGAAMMFDKMDTSKDGQLSKAELETGHKPMLKQARDTGKESTK